MDLTATPAPGSRFVGWSDPNCKGTGLCEFFINEDRSVTANFEASTPQEQTPAQQTPAQPPNTLLGGHPGKSLKSGHAKKKVTFRFSATEAAATFQCKLDKGDFKPCSSPKTYQVKVGKHNFSVRAVGAGGTDATPASYRFTVKAKH